eukprot:3377093-Alexandrium_andersonii.AAC.1
MRGPRNGLEIGTGSSRGVDSVPLFVEIPILPVKAGLEGARGREIAISQGSNPQSANPQCAQSFATGAREAGVGT